MNLNKQTLLILLVPVLFIVGIVSFFIFLPEELRSLTNLIGYTASLSTTIMVLVYIITTSRQLDTMSKQLSEMQYSRDVQVQPLPYLEKGTASIILPRYYTGPTTNFTKMELCTYVKASFAVVNHGNGPAIFVDFVTSLLSGPLVRTEKKLDKDTVSPHVDCVPLTTRNIQKIEFQWDNGTAGQDILESLIGDFRLVADFSIAYKNALGKPFEESIAFWLEVKSEKDLETLKTSLKLVKTATIDFAKQLQEFEKLALVGREDEKIKVLEEINKKIAEILQSDEIELEVEIARKSFEVHSISEKEYEEWLNKKEAIEASIKEEIHRCWEKEDGN